MNKASDSSEMDILKAIEARSRECNAQNYDDQGISVNDAIDARADTETKRSPPKRSTDTSDTPKEMGCHEVAAARAGKTAHAKSRQHLSRTRGEKVPTTQSSELDVLKVVEARIRASELHTLQVMDPSSGDLAEEGKGVATNGTPSCNPCLQPGAFRGAPGSALRRPTDIDFVTLINTSHERLSNEPRGQPALGSQEENDSSSGDLETFCHSSNRSLGLSGHSKHSATGTTDLEEFSQLGIGLDEETGDYLVEASLVDSFKWRGLSSRYMSNRHIPTAQILEPSSGCLPTSTFGKAICIIVIVAACVTVTTGIICRTGMGRVDSADGPIGPFSLENPIKSKNKKALIIGALQDCFMEADVTSTGKMGSLAVRHTPSLLPVINKAREERDCLFDIVVRSEDSHPKLHISWASTHGLPPFAHTLGKGSLPITCLDLPGKASCCQTYWIDRESQDCDKVLCPVEASMTQAVKAHVLASPACSYCLESPDSCFLSVQEMWPDHCDEQDEAGIPPSLYTTKNDVVVKVGNNDYVDAYSVFWDNTRNIETPVDKFLKSLDIDTIYLMGLTTGYGIVASAEHGIRLGYNVKVVLDATRYIAEKSFQDALEKMKDLSVDIISVDDLLAMECPDE
jgi:nicotinamidase-related amidase